MGAWKSLDLEIKGKGGKYTVERSEPISSHGSRRPSWEHPHSFWQNSLPDKSVMSPVSAGSTGQSDPPPLPMVVEQSNQPESSLPSLRSDGESGSPSEEGTTSPNAMSIDQQSDSSSAQSEDENLTGFVFGPLNTSDEGIENRQEWLYAGTHVSREHLTRPEEAFTFPQGTKVPFPVDMLPGQEFDEELHMIPATRMLLWPDLAGSLELQRKDLYFAEYHYDVPTTEPLDPQTIVIARDRIALRDAASLDEGDRWEIRSVGTSAVGIDELPSFKVRFNGIEGEWCRVSGGRRGQICLLGKRDSRQESPPSVGGRIHRCENGLLRASKQLGGTTYTRRVFAE